VAAIHNRTTDLDIDSIDHEADSSFEPEDEMTPQVQMKRKGQKQDGMTAIHEDNKSESETSRRQLRFDRYRDTSPGRSSLDSSSLEDDTVILHHRHHPKENKKMNPSLLPLRHWLLMMMTTKKLMKVKELLDVLIWQRDGSQRKLNSLPEGSECRLSKQMINTFRLYYDAYSDPELHAEEIELPFYCLKSDELQNSMISGGGFLLAEITSRYTLFLIIISDILK
jgi:hypothetical protein